MSSQKNSKTNKIMVVSDLPGEECRIAILEDNHLENLYTERAASATSVGNIYKGRVTNVEPAIQAAFVDFGHEQSGFLHITDLHPRYFPKGGPDGERSERVGRKIPRRKRPPIQNALKRGHEIIVQVLKEGLGTKGPTLTSYLSIPGRLLVMMPGMDRTGVSRKVEDENKRREMRKRLEALNLPDDLGFILRTAGVDRSKTELKRDSAYLMRLWKVMEKRINSVAAPCELYTESDLVIRTIRDVLSPAIGAIVVDSDSAYERAKGFLDVIAPRSAPKVVRYDKPGPIFHAFDIERQIELIHNREVPLPSGGALVIEQTEAMVAVDVNSGRSRDARDSETNAYNTNCEAVDELCRQLRLRDLGGLILNDLIDMRNAKNRRAIEQRVRETLKRDRAKTTVLAISEFGVLEMTRQRMRPSLRKTHYTSCPACDGRGEIKMPESVSADAVRQIGYLLQFDRVQRIEMVCSPRVASVLLSNKRRELVRLEDDSGKRVVIRISESIAIERVDFYAYDGRGADVEIPTLPSPPIPTIKQLLKGEKEDAKSGKDGDRPRKESKSRRKSSGPADATAMALAGGFEPDGQKSDDPGKGKDDQQSSRRRRRRKNKKSDQPEAKSQGDKSSSKTDQKQPSNKKSRDDDKQADHGRIRVHELAKKLGVKSKEVLDCCRSELDVEVKNHMASLSQSVSDKVRSALEKASKDNSKAHGPDESSVKDSRGGKSSRKRRRRSRRSRSKSEAGDNGQVQSGGDQTASTQDDSSKRNEQKNSDQKDNKKPKGGQKDDQSDSSKSDSTQDKPSKPKRRRSLYASRRRVSPSAKKAAQRVEKP